MYCRPKVIKAEWNDAFGIFSVPVIYTPCTELYFNFYYYNNKIKITLNSAHVSEITSYTGSLPTSSFALQLLCRLKLFKNFAVLCFRPNSDNAYLAT
jgi:hypothetical protein